MPATDVGETSGSHNLKPWPTSPEDTMYIDAGLESLNQYILIKYLFEFQGSQVQTRGKMIIFFFRWEYFSRYHSSTSTGTTDVTFGTKGHWLGRRLGRNITIWHRLKSHYLKRKELLQGEMQVAANLEHSVLLRVRYLQFL